MGKPSIAMGLPAAALCYALHTQFGHASPPPVVHGQDPDTGLRSWTWKSEGVRFELKQLLPDQTRAFFLARGFDADSADRFATSCVFQSVFENTGSPGSGSVRFDQRSWRVRVQGRTRPMPVRADWAAEWEDRGLSPAARIAFEWSLLPTIQQYEPGDYNWGMTSYALLPGTGFDLEFSWDRDGEGYQGLLQGLECPPDIHLDPAS